MGQRIPIPRVDAFLIKVASRCNLRCDYCYVYEHADQSWRAMPRFMSEERQALVARRLSEYASDVGLQRVLVIFHGGEPMLFGARHLAAFAARIRALMPPETRLDFSVQTNGTLLDYGSLEALADARIAVSISLDGPRDIHDRHRPDHSGRGSFDATLQAIELLRARPECFSGIIAVIDPQTDPERTLEFFSVLKPPSLDLLLPDANHFRPPPGREYDTEIYCRWLRRAFDCWFDKFSSLPIRLFDAVLDAIVGKSSGTDAFGLGDVNLITIETDGTYHDLDVLKITREGRTALGLNLIQHSVHDATASPVLDEHRRLLTPAGLAPECRQCPELATCGGGSVPHRFGPRGFMHPTVYCAEMLDLIGHARCRLVGALETTNLENRRPLSVQLDAGWVDRFERPGGDFLEHLFELAARRADSMLVRAVNSVELLEPNLQKDARWILAQPEPIRRSVAVLPSVVLWSRVLITQSEARRPVSRSGRPLPVDPTYLSRIADWLREGLPIRPSIHRDDLWLRVPFDADTEFEQDAEVIQIGGERIHAAMDLISGWHASVVSEIIMVSPEIQFIQDRLAPHDRIVSFSDDVVPGALYVSVRRGKAAIDPVQLADSLLHEHRHQRLYLLQQIDPLVARDWPAVRSPWREELRPPSGLLHALYVFVGLRELWENFRAIHPDARIREQAAAEIAAVDQKLATGFDTIETCALTPAGSTLVEHLRKRVTRSN